MVAKQKDEPGVREYLQAGYPCLFLPTVEPEVAEARVRDALLKLDLGMVDFGVWKVTTGAMIGSADGTVKPSKRQEDLIDVLAGVEKADRPLVVLLHNVRAYLDDPGITQALIDAVFAARLKGSHIVMVGAFIQLPPELRSLVTYVDCPLPTQDAIRTSYEEMVEAYRDDIDDLPADKEEFDQLMIDAARAAVGLDMMGAENAIALSLATASSIDCQIIQAQKEQEVRKSDVLEFVRITDTMQDVGGFAEFKGWLTRREKAFSHEAREYGLPYPKGMLIVGPAGTGKSLTAKAVGAFLRLPLLRLDMGKVFRSLVGESEAAIRMALQVAEAVSPVVLWMDEIDKGLAGMKGSGELDSGVTSRVVSTVLTWRQETQKPVVLVGTANDVSSIPSMVYRKGRLDEVWATDLPMENERDEIFKIHLRKRNRDPENFDTALLAARSELMVGAEIEAIIEDAMFAAFSDGVEVETSHVLQAIAETIPQAERDAEEIKAIREWVETRARLVSGGDALVKVKSTAQAKVKTLRTRKSKPRKEK